MKYLKMLAIVALFQTQTSLANEVYDPHIQSRKCAHGGRADVAGRRVDLGRLDDVEGFRGRPEEVEIRRRP